MHKHSSLSFLFVTAVLFLPLLATAAQSAAEKGLAIAIEADKRDEGWTDSSATMTMILRDAYGKTSTREMRSKSLEVADDGDKGLIIFDEPKDVRGTALLTFSHTTGDDDQWLYLPALKRVKRISSRNKTGPFMSSEFAYEDLGSQEVEKYTYTYIRDELYEAQPCFVIDRVPVDEKSGYSRQRAWIDQAEYRVLKVEYYDRKQTLLKTLTLHDYKQYANKHWRAGRLEMKNHQTDKHTTLSFAEYRFKQGMDDSDFNQSALKRLK